MINSWIILSILGIFSFSDFGYYLPINALNRTSVHAVKLTEIGTFGILRKERPGIPSHFHTGIDIRRPSNNYHDEAIYPVYEGLVISKRQDGPFAQLIIEHENKGKFWTVYEHIAGIKVDLYDYVSPESPIARFMNKDELDKYGWQFDHFHFEVLKTQPMPLEPDNSRPHRLFRSYTLLCESIEDLNKHFYNPLDFLEKKLK